MQKKKKEIVQILNLWRVLHRFSDTRGGEAVKHYSLEIIIYQGNCFQFFFLFMYKSTD